MPQRLARAAALLVAGVLAGACGSTAQQRSAEGEVLPGGPVAAGESPLQPVERDELGGGAPLPGAAATPGAAGAPAGTAGSAPRPARSAAGSGSQHGRATGSGVLPATGPGWDRTNAYVGVVTNQDISTAVGALGITSLDSGDQRAAAESMIAEMNARGGLLGRKVVGVFFDVSTTENRETSAQATCAHFTQDNRVIAVLNAAGQNDTPAFRACMSKARTLVLSTALVVQDDASLDRERGWYLPTLTVNWSRFSALLVERLRAMSFFDGWDTGAGAPGRQPVKVGILSTDSPDHQRVVALLTRLLTQAGHAPVRTVYGSLNAHQGAVLQFRSDGVTHVLSTDALLFSFMQNAESQGYRPRYAVHTINLPLQFLAATAPQVQLRGAMGVGWAPQLDVDHRRDPSPALIPGKRTCDEIAQRRGPRYAAERRYAVLYGYLYCDMLRLVGAATASAGSLASEQLRVAIRHTADRVAPASTFVNGLSARSAAMPASGLDLRWDAPCSCFAYSGGLRR